MAHTTHFHTRLFFLFLCGFSAAIDAFPSPPRRWGILPSHTQTQLQGEKGLCENPSPLLLAFFCHPAEGFHRILKEWIGQLLMVGFSGTSPHDPQVAQLAQAISRGYVGSVILYQRNIQNKNQIATLIKHFKAHAGEHKIGIATDQEGGRVQRLKKSNGFSDFLSAAEVAKTMTPAQAFVYYQDLAQQLADIGINFNLAPLGDLNRNPNSPAIGKYNRSYSDDPQIVTVFAFQFIQAHHLFHVLTALKHYPGHGSATADSHLGMTDISHTWDPIELIPFDQLAAVTDAVMSAHLINTPLDPDFPASLSFLSLQKLREKAPSHLVIISDDLLMKAITDHYGLKEAVIHALEAGTDILLFSKLHFNKEELQPIYEKVQDIVIEEISNANTALRDRVEESYQRIIKLKEKLIF